jgi:ADP-ribose pyrophosphatase
MAFNLHPNAEKLHDGVRVNLLVTERARRSGGVQRREIAEVADAVVILPLLEDAQVVLIQNERFAVGQTLWELPAGTLEPDEDPAACAARELAEETGYEAQQIERLTAFYPSPGFCTEKLHAYRATGLKHVGQSLEETERITPHVVALDEAYAMVRDGRIEDAKTIAALLYHHAFG